MSYTFKLSGGTEEQLQIARVRDEIDDVSASNAEDGGIEGKDYFLSDERIANRLTGASELYSAPWAIVYEAAARCLGTLSTNQAYVLKKKSTLSEDVDGTAVASSIRADARVLSDKAAKQQLKADADANAEAGQVNRTPPSQAVRIRPVW